MSEFWNSTLIKKSRKVHRCEHCHVKIEIGQPYIRETGKYEGEFNNYSLCVRCKTLLTNNNSVWDDDEELGEFHDKFMDSRFAKCPRCGHTDIYNSIYSDDMMSVEIICNCLTSYTVDLSAENLLKKEAQNERL